MHLRAIASGLALAFLVGFSASAGTVSGASGAGATASAVDMGLLNSLMSGRPLVVAAGGVREGRGALRRPAPVLQGLYLHQEPARQAGDVRLQGLTPNPAVST